MAQLPKPVKGERKKAKETLASKLDRLAGELCRARGVCEAAGWRSTECNGALQWAHIVSRESRRNNLRWRMDNCFCLCQGHHWRWTRKNYAEWRAFVYEKIGVGKAVRLDKEADQGAKADHEAALAYLDALTHTDPPARMIRHEEMMRHYFAGLPC